MLLARKVIAYGPPDKVITPDALLQTFGIVISSEKRRLSVIETHHGHGDSHEDHEEHEHK
jgi:manganese/iron transport system ATP-binding protein/manganese transport system ATP-binding protein/manganese/zinc/iron transport system ATP- binding protein